MAEEPEEEQGTAAGRPFWSGAITFGLVTIPVAIHAGTRPRGTSMKMLGPGEAPVRRRYVCSKDEKPLEADEIVRGYEIEKGKYVVVTDEELESIEPRRSREIDLRLFVDRAELDPVFFERGYFLVPAGGTNKAYRLLAEVMEQKDQAGIATFVMRAKEYLVAIVAENGILRAEMLRFADEIRSPEEVGLPDVPKPAAADVKKFEAQITRHAKKLDVSELLDDYGERLHALAEKKAKKGEDVVKAAPAAREEEGGGEVVDLLAALSRSLGGGTQRKPARRRAPAKKRGSRKR